jgi:predicted aspartyl protease
MRWQGSGDLVAVGVTYVDGRARGPAGEEDVHFLVDSGAIYSLLPYDVWKRIGIEPTDEREFGLADGSVVRRAMSDCYVSLEFGGKYTPVILGEPSDDVALLGVVTLEEFGLILDPISRSLRKRRLTLLRSIA